MSEDKEKEVSEQTRRNHSGIHAMTGNIVKGNAERSSKNYNENEVKNPIKAVGILAGATLILIAAVYVLYHIILLF